MLLRSAAAQDAPGLTSLAGAAKAAWGYPSEWLAAWRDDLAITPEYIAEHRVFAAARDDVLVGMCALEDHHDHWVLEHVWVAPAHQGRGIGKALVRRALSVVQELRPGAVRVEADPNAAGFYRRLGARESGSVPAPVPGAPQRRLPHLEFPLGRSDPRPVMHTDARLGTFDDCIAKVGPDVQRIARRLRTLIAKLHPAAVEVPRPGEPTVGYGVGPKKMTESYAYIAPHGDHVNLGFYHGTALPDPGGLLEGTGNALRHVKVRSMEEADRPALMALVKAALEERRTALGAG